LIYRPIVDNIKIDLSFPSTVPMKALLFLLLLAYGITTSIYLGLYAPTEMEMNNTIFYSPNNGTWTNPTGKYVVSQNAMLVCATFISASLLLYNQDPRTEKSWHVAIVCVWGFVDLLLVIVSYVFSITSFSDMCQKHRCFKPYTPLHWLLLTEFVWGSIVFGTMLIIVIWSFIDPCIGACCPGFKRRYDQFFDDCCIRCCDDCCYWINGPKWQNPSPVEVERGQNQTSVMVAPVNFHYQADDQKQLEKE
jgi:hypothetical protein